MSYEKLMEKYKGNLKLQFGIECGVGWYKLIDNTLMKIKKLYPKIEIVQIKEKFGMLRVYTGGIPYKVSRRIQTIIQKAEQTSGIICEQCGKPGKVCKINGWYSTLCERHEKQKRAPLLTRIKEVLQ